MGDAAHTMSPTGAFGISAALVDAEVLSDVLVEALRLGDTSAGQLKQFELLRRDAVEKLQEIQRVKEETYRKNFAVPTLY